MANSASPFRRPRPRPRPRPTLPLARPVEGARRGRLQHQTTLVHQLFKEYDEAAREERRACDALDECEECLAARARTEGVKDRLLRATRDLNSL